MKIKLIRVVVSFFMIFLLGCSKSATSGPTDPVEELEKTIAEAGWQFVYNRTEWKNIQYDVKKTDSLVSPYQATIKAKLIGFNRKKSAEEYDVNKPDTYSLDNYEETPYDRNDVEITLAFQSESWVIKEIIRTWGTFDDSQTWRPIIDREALMQDSSFWDAIKRQLKLYY